MEQKAEDDKNIHRRDFIKNALISGVAVSLQHENRFAELDKNWNKGGQELNAGANKLMALFNLKYPIFQAAPGGETLAIALANAGAMGALSMSWLSSDDAFEIVTRMKTATKGNFYGNYVLHFEPKSLDKALEAGIPCVQFSWGIPSKKIVSKIKAAKVKLGIQVASRENAKSALEHNPDFLICQGVEAGGHVQANEPLLASLKDVLAEAKDVPVLAAGGIATGHDIRKMINAGASGTVIGSRFIATHESDLHDEYKRSLVNAGKDSTVFTTCFNREWFALHRVLKNKTFQIWQAAGCPLPGNRPGEDDVIAGGKNGDTIKRYSITSPKKWMHGNVTELAMYAGEGVENINDISSAKEILLRLWEEFKNDTTSRRDGLKA
jgi:nitronate monooxygenase